ncbi:putative LRR receptor-like serine/threonine-protein kinase [Tetrabaena socialis]|uniref:Putative LRR receptor-like serine/threonine-protein kinase n=1 Tax=Tetrabaena socialis TaxID=47790 RepID=A0A2J8AHF2_9CHLO|nr:putative LRR receptor-like serine/threonine-protein kinase [Tetrabaena socialis]|eukprot:PNH11931.1 putative LRR receptor-like serine/threonine-protein kinase [Tetrabaena socialis]
MENPEELAADVELEVPDRLLRKAEAIIAARTDRILLGGSGSGQIPGGDFQTGGSGSGQIPGGDFQTGGSGSGQIPGGDFQTGGSGSGQIPGGDFQTGGSGSGQIPGGDFQTGGSGSGQIPGGDFQTGGSGSGQIPGGDFQTGGSSSGQIPGRDFQTGGSGSGQIPGGDFQTGGSGQIPGGNFQTGGSGSGQIPGRDFQTGSSGSGQIPGGDFQTGGSGSGQIPGGAPTDASGVGHLEPPIRVGGPLHEGRRLVEAPAPPPPGGQQYTLITLWRLADMLRSGPAMVLAPGQQLSLSSAVLFLTDLWRPLGASPVLPSLALPMLFDVPANASLWLTDVVIVLSAADLRSAMLSICSASGTDDFPYSPGVVVDGGVVRLIDHSSRVQGKSGAGAGGEVRWTNVMLTCLGFGLTHAPCAACPVATVKELTTAMDALLVAAMGPVYLSITADLALPRDGSWKQVGGTVGSAGGLVGVPLGCLLVLMGDPSLQQQRARRTMLDLAGVDGVWADSSLLPDGSIETVVLRINDVPVQPIGVAHLRDLQLVNVGYSSTPRSWIDLQSIGMQGPFRVAGSFTSDDLESGPAPPLLKLRVLRCTLVVPDPELAFLVRAAAASASGQGVPNLEALFPSDGPQPRLGANPTLEGADGRLTLGFLQIRRLASSALPQAPVPPQPQPPLMPHIGPPRPQPMEGGNDDGSTANGQQPAGNNALHPGMNAGSQPDSGRPAWLVPVLAVAAAVGGVAVLAAATWGGFALAARRQQQRRSSSDGIYVKGGGVGEGGTSAHHQEATDAESIAIIFAPEAGAGGSTPGTKRSVAHARDSNPASVTGTPFSVLPGSSDDSGGLVELAVRAAVTAAVAAGTRSRVGQLPPLPGRGGGSGAGPEERKGAGWSQEADSAGHSSARTSTAAVANCRELQLALIRAAAAEAEAAAAATGVNALNGEAAPQGAVQAAARAQAQAALLGLNAMLAPVGSLLSSRGEAFGVGSEEGIIITERNAYFDELRDGIMRVVEPRQEGPQEQQAGRDSAHLRAGPSRRQPGGDAQLSRAINNIHAELRDPDLDVRVILGCGSFGVVYAGVWRGLPVAVKTLIVPAAIAAGLGLGSSCDGREGRARKRAVLEAAISLSLMHPNVVSTYTYELRPLVQEPPPGPAPDWGSESTSRDGGGGSPSCVEEADGHKLYIVQELCNGGSLRYALAAGMAGSVARGGACRRFALRLALDVALGMAHVHSRRIVHGDLKPDNVLLVSGTRHNDAAHAEGTTMPESLPAAGAGLSDHDPSVAAMAAGGGDEGSSGSGPGAFDTPLTLTAKVADFGLSLPLEEGATHASHRFQGTPMYSAPELVAAGRLSPKADLWSFGLMLLELFYGCTLETMRSVHGTMAVGMQPAELVAGGAQWRRPLHEVLLEEMRGSPHHLFAELAAACLRNDPRLRPSFEEVAALLQPMCSQGSSCSQCVTAAVMTAQTACTPEL